MEIAIRLYKNEQLAPDSEASNHLKQYLTVAYNKRDKFFGNAREVRKIVQESIKNQNLRMAEMDVAKRTREMISTVTKADVAEFDFVKLENNSNKKGIGF